MGGGGEKVLWAIFVPLLVYLVNASLNKAPDAVRLRAAGVDHEKYVVPNLVTLLFPNHPKKISRCTNIVYWCAYLIILAFIFLP